MINKTYTVGPIDIFEKCNDEIDFTKIYNIETLLGKDMERIQDRDLYKDIAINFKI